MNKPNHTQSQLRSKIRWGVFSLIALLIIAIFFILPRPVNQVINKVNSATGIGFPTLPTEDFRLGLDLKGGAHLVYQADTTQFSEAEKGEAIEGVREVIERRVNGFGVGEANVQSTKVGVDYRLIVELPGIQDVNAAIKMIGGTPILEFKEENDIPPRDLTPEEQKSIDEYNKDAEQRAKELLKKIKDGASFEEVARESSEDTGTKEKDGYLGFIPESAMLPSFQTWVEKAEPGDVSKTLVTSTQGYHILKLGETREGEPQVTASHILICYLGAQRCDNAQYTKQEAEAKAKEIFEQATAKNFADLAKEFSTEPGADTSGGDLGTFGRGRMTPAFEEAVFNAEAGQIIGPVETEFGYHVIYKKDEQPSKEYELSHIFVRTQSATDILPPQDPWKTTGLTGKQLDKAEVVTDPQTGAIQIALQFDSEGKELFRDITTRNVGKPIAIFLDGELSGAPPVVQTPITDGQAVITGNFTLMEARQRVRDLNTGALPVPIELVSQQTIGASLGAESLQKSLYAGIVGVIIVMIYMLLYYRLPGLISVVALIIYISLSLALFKLIGVTLTLAGIAGFILSIGMAVDANVLIFERLKEELTSGKSLKLAVEEGFIRAWSSIRDGNISTLITCLMLIWLGTSFVKAFAITLSIGILVSMFTAITASRLFLRLVVPWIKDRGGVLFLGGRKAE